MIAVGVQHAVPRAVHWLHAPLLLLHEKVEHVLLVVPGMAARVPQVKMENVRGDHLLVPVVPVLLLHELQQTVVDPRAVWLEEARARGDVVEKVQVLLRANHPVVPLLGLLDLVHVLFQELLVWEAHAVDPVEGGVLDVTAPERARVLVELEGLDHPGVRHVGSAAQVAEGAVPVQGDGGALRQALDHLHLEGVLLEHVERLLPGDHRALKLLLLLDDLVDALGENLAVLRVQGLVAHEAVVVEALLDGRTNGEVRAVLELQSLAQQVGGGVPVRVLALSAVEGEDLELAVALEGPEHIPVLAVDLRHQGLLAQPLADSGGDVLWGGHVTCSLPHRTVGKGDRNLHALLGGLRGVELGALEVLLEESDTLVVVGLFYLGVRGLSRDTGATPTLAPGLVTRGTPQNRLVLGVLLAHFNEGRVIGIQLPVVPPARHT
mmetsp:Transcript_10549/g.36441  ORF Transcript_10549/g.36441 Transcript_10549/m.36441 type:complete len:435 (-) Transcript_10549:257-1561(-)